MVRAFTLTSLFILFSLSPRAQLIFTIAGNGTAGYGGDNGPANLAVLHTPDALAIDRYNNVLIGDYGNSRVRKINALTDTITTVVGNGIDGDAGEGGLAINAEIDRPNGVAVDTFTNIYVADDDRARILKVTVPGDTIRSIAGTGTPGYNGDNIPATSAQLWGSYGVTTDYAGNVYIADYNSNRVRKVTAATGIITTIAGTGTPGYNGDNIAATSAELYNPYGVNVDTAGNVYICDRSNNRLRKVDKQGIIHTLAGNGTAGYNGDGVAATSELSGPTGAALDAAGNIYIADLGNSRLRKITVATGMISTIAGTGTPGYNGDSIPATSAELNAPIRVALDAYGNIYLTEFNGNRLRKIVLNDTVSIKITSSVDTICAGTPVTFTSATINGGTHPTYQWKVNGVLAGGDSATFTSSALQNNDTVVCVVTSNAPGVTGNPATSNPVVITVTPPDTVSATITPSSPAICPGTQVNFSAGVTNGGSSPAYQWLVNGIIEGGDSATFSSSDLQNGDTVVCIVSSNAGCVTGSPATSNEVVMSVAPSFVAGTITASANPVCEGAGTSLTGHGSTGAIQWESSLTANNFSDITNATDSIYSWNSTQTTYFRVIAGSGNCADTSPPYQLIVNPLPVPAIPFTRDSVICASDSAMLQEPGNFATYLWSDGDTSPYTYAKNAGGYWVTVTDINGCTAISAHRNISVYPVSSVSIIEAGDTLSSYGAISYQWFYNANLIPGATSPEYIARQTGDYAVQIVDTNSCAELSTATYVAINGVQTVSTNPGLKIYPNPLSNSIFIQVNDVSIRINRVEIYDVQGRILFNEENNISVNLLKIDVPDLPKGVYMLKILTGEADYIQSVIRQ